MKQILDFKQQPKNVLTDYIEYAEGKIDIGEVPLAFPDWARIEFDEDSPISKSIATPTSKEGLEDGGFTKGEWKVVKLGESWKVKEWAAVANVQYGGGDSDFVILAPVNTATLLHMEAKANAELIVKAVNNFPAMVEIIKQVKFWFDNESTYPPFTGGYRIAQQAKAILTRINKD